jgi:F-type H+-transporting ATPase subunit gamma
MFAMDNATKNADDMLQSLHKVYHKTRQQNITQEIMEIIGGSEAL